MTINKIKIKTKEIDNDFKKYLDIVFEKYYKSFIGRIMNITHNSTNCNDILQDIYLFILEGSIDIPDLGNNIERIKRWVYRVIYYISINRECLIHKKYFMPNIDDRYSDLLTIDSLPYRIDDDEDIKDNGEQPFEKLQRFKETLDKTNQLYWTDKQFLRDLIYRYDNNVSKFSRMSGISYCTISSRSKYAKKIIISIMEGKLPLIVDNPIYFVVKHNKKTRKALDL